MKKIILTILFVLLYSASVNAQEWKPFEDYNWEMEFGFDIDDVDKEKKGAADEPIQEDEIKLKNKINTQSPDVLKCDLSPIELKLGKQQNISNIKEVFSPPKTTDELYNDGRLKIYGEGKKELSDYMTYNFKSSMNLNYSLSKHIDISAGQEVWYVNPDAALGTKKFYINPKVSLTDNFYLDYTNSYNEVTKNIEQEAGVNYKPKIFHNAASFGLKAGVVINNETGKPESNSLKFSTDFYF